MYCTLTHYTHQASIKSELNKVIQYNWKPSLFKKCSVYLVNIFSSVINYLLCKANDDGLIYENTGFSWLLWNQIENTTTNVIRKIHRMLWRSIAKDFFPIQTKLLRPIIDSRNIVDSSIVDTYGLVFFCLFYWHQ